MNLFKRTIPSAQTNDKLWLSCNPGLIMGRSRTDQRLEYLSNLITLYDHLKDLDGKSELMERINRTADRVEQDLSIVPKEFTIYGDGTVFHSAGNSEFIRYNQVNMTHRDAKIISNALQDRMDLVNKSSRDGEEEYKQRLSSLIDLFKNFPS